MQALPYQLGTDPPAGNSGLQALATAIDPKLVMVFASASARASAITSPTLGMLSWLNDKARYEKYNGTNWVPLWTSGAVTVNFNGSQENHNFGETYSVVPTGVIVPTATPSALCGLVAVGNITTSTFQTVSIAITASGSTSNPGHSYDLTWIAFW
jgi:hypothetical protein